MFGFSGKLICTHPPSRRDRFYHVRFQISMFPPSVAVFVTDPVMETTHLLDNSRFNFQSRDSYLDLLARDAWKSVWYDKYSGLLNLDCPTLSRVPPALDVRVIASWTDPFVVVEFKLNDDYCQVSTRPRSGARGWRRIQYESSDHTRLIPEGTDDTNETHELASSSLRTDPPPRPVCLDFGANASHIEELSDFDDISIARLTEAEAESVRDAESVFSSDPDDRNLSSVATLTTYAPGNEDVYYPLEPEPDYIEIDYERIESTSTRFESSCLG